MANFNWAFVEPTAVAVDPGAGTTIDLSSGTEVNTSLKGAGTSLGTTSTLQVAAVHGRFDAGLDAYCNFVNIGPAPIRTGGHAQRTLRVTLSVGTLPTENPNSGCFLLIVIAPQADLLNQRGYGFGIARGSGVNKSSSSVIRFGAGPGSSDTLTGTPVLSTLTAVFDQDGETGVAGVGITRAEDSGWKDATTTSDITGTFTDVFVGVGMSQVNASPSTVVTWSNVTLTYSWT